MTPSKVPMPQAPFTDPDTGYLTRTGTNFLNSLTQNANAAAAGSVTTAPGSGLFGGGAVADGISIGIAPSGVTNAMIRQSAGYSVLGRYAGSTGDVADITATADGRALARIGGVLAFWDLTLIPATVGDGDYGDITVSGVGTVWTINNAVVTFAKIQNIATDRLVGRDTAGTGSIEQLTVGGGVEFTGTGGIQTSAFTGDATKPAGGTALTLATVNADTGAWGSATQAPVITLDAKGRATAASAVTITPAASSITGGAALTRTNDTNVTLTLGGSPATALLAGTSITVGWSGILAVARGGLGVGTVTGILQGNGTSAVTAITDSSTTGEVLRATGASTYAWGALSLSTPAAITGTLPIGNGGTGITAFGTGVAAALGINVGSAGAFVTFNGALGTPSSGTLTNCTGLPNASVVGLGSMALQAASAVAITGGTATGLTNITLAGGSFDATAQGQIYSTANLGLVLHGKGTTYDTLFTNKNGSTLFDNPTGTLICEFGGDIYPLNNNTQYLGKNSSTAPQAWKGLILCDQTSGAIYRLDINSGAVRLTAL